MLLKKFLNSTGVTTDSRTIKGGEIFFALSGEHFNGNEFALQALDAGADFVVISEDRKGIPADKFMLVDDTLVALQTLAKIYRQRLGIPVLAITGSNGKTTTKELCARVLSTHKKVFATQGNYNNHIGVPLTLLSLNKSHEIAVVEMGANHQKEIELLCDIALPDAGLITNIGKAHLEGFGGIEGVLKGKTELFKHLQQNAGDILWNADDTKLNEIQQEFSPAISYGTQGEITGSLLHSSPYLNCLWNVKSGKSYEINTHITGSYNFQNVLAAVACGVYFNIPEEDIVKAISSYEPENNRSQIDDFKGYKVIRDFYNANPSSVEAALLNLSGLSGKKYFILGDMLECGETEIIEHERIIELCALHQLQGIFIGPLYSKCSHKHGFQVFETKEACINYLKSNIIPGGYILIKGSRGMKMEQILDIL